MQVSTRSLFQETNAMCPTRCGLDGLGIESQWGRHFPRPYRPALGPTQPPVQRVPGLFPRGKAAGAWRGLDRNNFLCRG
jgi:hypothetical protein